jgi:hypothetical protein
MSLIAAGFYRAVAVPMMTPDGETWAQFGESKNGNSQVVVNFEILDGPEAGRRIAWFGYFTEKTVQRTVESLRYCGFTGDDLAAATVQRLENEVQLVINHEEYDGKMQARVSWVNRAGGGGVKLEKPMDKRGLDRFAAMMRNAVRSVPEVSGKKAERNAKPASTTPEDDRVGDGPPAEWSRSASPMAADDDIPF